MNALWHPGMRGFPWHTQYMAVGNREIWSVTITEDLSIREGGTIIQGAIWESGLYMQEFYDTYYQDGDEGKLINNGNHIMARGFVGWSHQGEAGFSTWEEAILWVTNHETQ